MMHGTAGARGIVHVHTGFSFDGVLQPQAIARKCRDRGLSFAAIADHAESMTERHLEQLVAECAESSDSNFTMIPGLEHRYRGGVHILSLGQSRWVTATTPRELLQRLADDGVALVAAHCSSPADLPAELLEILTAVEIWNVSRDTRLLPTTRQFLVYRKWAKTYPALYAIGGLDMHKGIEWGCEVVIPGQSGLTAESVLQSLRAGQFYTAGRLLTFASRPAARGRNIAFAAGDALVGVRNLRDRVLR